MHRLHLDADADAPPNTSTVRSFAAQVRARLLDA